MPPAPVPGSGDDAEPAVQLPIRPPLPARIWIAAIGAVGSLPLAAQVVLSLAGSRWLAALVTASFWAVWLTGTVRTARLAVLIDAAGRLVVRNTGRTRTFRAEEVADVRLPRSGLSSLGRSGALEVVLTDGSVRPMEATARPPFGRSPTTARRDAILAALDRPR